MKKQLFFVLFLGMSLSAWGQNIRVKYQFFLNDSLGSNKVLYLGGDTSIWQDIEESTPLKKDGLFVVNYLDSKIRYSNDKFGRREYFVRDTTSFAEQKWVLTSETKNILGQPCNSAEIVLRGVKHKVFYAPNIPTQLGPWKFVGLPGLILEANGLSDLKYHLVASEIIKVPGAALNKLADTHTAGNRNWVTWDEYKAQFKKMIDDQSKKIKSSGLMSIGSSTKFKISKMEMVYPEAQMGEGLLIEN